MRSRVFFRPRPIKTVWRFSHGYVAGVAPSLPCHGFWVMSYCSGGGGSGSTHASYASPSERGTNGDSSTQLPTYRRSWGAITLGDGGIGGALTNDANISAQHGADGAPTSGGPNGAAAGGVGGRGAIESTGLSPSRPASTYPNTVDPRSVTGGALLGIWHVGGTTTSTPDGRGADGNSAPPGTPASAGKKGEAGRADYYLRG